MAEPDAAIGALEKAIRLRAITNASRDVNASVQRAFANVQLDSSCTMAVPYAVHQAIETALKSAEQSIGDRAVLDFHKKYQQLLEEFPIGA